MLRFIFIYIHVEVLDKKNSCLSVSKHVSEKERVNSVKKAKREENDGEWKQMKQNKVRQLILYLSNLIIYYGTKKYTIPFVFIYKTTLIFSRN